MDNREACFYAISEIDKFINRYYPDYQKELYTWTKRSGYFRDYSYSRWSAFEIIERLCKEVDKLPPHLSDHWVEVLSPVDVISEFIDEMQECLYATYPTDKAERVFTIATDVAEDIRALFIN